MSVGPAVEIGFAIAKTDPKVAACHGYSEPVVLAPRARKHGALLACW
jgi:hypothetical protein